MRPRGRIKLDRSLVVIAMVIPDLCRLYVLLEVADCLWKDGQLGLDGGNTPIDRRKCVVSGEVRRALGDPRRPLPGHGLQYVLLDYRRAALDCLRELCIDRGVDQCWAGIDKKHTRGYGYPSNQERPHGYGHGYDMCSGILARVEFNTRAMPDETTGAYTYARIDTRGYLASPRLRCATPTGLGV